MMAEKNKWKDKTKLQAHLCSWLHQTSLEISTFEVLIWWSDSETEIVASLKSVAMNTLPSPDLAQPTSTNLLPLSSSSHRKHSSTPFHSYRRESEFRSAAGHHSTTLSPHLVLSVQGYLLLSRPECISVHPIYSVRNIFNLATMCAAYSTEVFQHSYQATELE